MTVRRQVRRLRGALHALREDRSGAIAPMVVAVSASLLAAAGLALDVGLFYVDNRELRSATEAAALAAAMDPAQAETRARDYLVRNGYDASVLHAVQIGRYCADGSLNSADRFDATMSWCPGNGQANAVKIETVRKSRRFLTGILGANVIVPDLAATASAARIDEAGVEITTGLLTVTNSLVNAVNDLLGALLGIKLRLSTADIEALMGGNVDAGLFFDALARRTGQTGTYAEVVAGTYGIGDIANAAADAAGTPATATALRTFATAAGNGYQVPLVGLFGLGVWKKMPVGEADEKPALRAGLNAYQLISYAVQAGPGAIDLSDAVSLAVPSSTVRVAAVASGPVDRPRFSFGPAGETSVGTSALRLQLQLGLGAVSLLGSQPIIDSVPLLIDVAAGQAALTGIDCAGSSEQAVDTRANVTASSGLVNAYIGNAPANAMTKPMPVITASDITQARLVNLLGLVTVDARAVAQPVLGRTATLAFGPGGQGTIGSPQAPGQSAHVGNGSQVGPLLTSLPASLVAPDGLQVQILGLCLPVVCEAQAAQVRQTLVSAITTPLTGLVGSTVDPLLDNVLAALGIELGHATVWVNGARCGVPVLI